MMKPDPIPLLGGARSGLRNLITMEKLRQRIIAITGGAGNDALLCLFGHADIDHRRTVFGDQAGEIRQSGDPSGCRARRRCLCNRPAWAT